MNADYLAIDELKIAKGAMFTAADVRAAAKVCVLAPATAEQLFGKEPAIGKTAFLERSSREDDPIELRVVGVLAAKGNGFDERPLPMQNLVPWTLVYDQAHGGRRGMTDLAAKAATREKVPEATKQITALLRKRRGVAPSQPDGFGISCNNQEIDRRVTQALAWEKAFPGGPAEMEKAMKAQGMLSLFGDADVDSKVSLEGIHSVKAFLTRGAARHSTGQLADAVADFSEAIRLDPKSVEAWSGRGMANCDRGEYDKAIADFSEVLRLAPQTFKARIARGAAYGKKGDHDKAIADFTAAIVVDPNYALAYGYRAMDYYRKGDREHALADLDHAIRLNACDGSFYRNRGMIHLDQGQFDKAIADCSEALWLNPLDGKAYQYRSAAYAKKNDKAKAAADADWAAKLAVKPNGVHAPPLAKIHFLAIAEQGAPIVKAMQDYRNEHGLWPQRVEDFAEKYLGHKDLGPWRYEWNCSGKRLFCAIGFPMAMAQYQIDSDGGHWELNYGDDQEKLAGAQPKAVPSKLSKQQLIDATIAEFHMRIAREPDQEVHRKGLIGFLIRESRLADAEKECMVLLARSPNDLGLVQKLNDILVREGKADRAVARLKAFVAANPSLNNQVALVNLYRSLGRRPEALAAARASLNAPEVTAPVNGDSADFSLFELGRIAYEEKEYDLVLAISQAWDDVDLQVTDSYERDYHALRAAAYLAQGKFETAAKHYRRAVRFAAHAGHGPLAGDLDSLKKAIDARDAKFAYRGLTEPYWRDRLNEYY